jgi:hypothetical protein
LEGSDTDGAILANIWMVDLRGEPYFRRFERILRWYIDGEKEDAASIRRTRLAM